MSSEKSTPELFEELKNNLISKDTEERIEALEELAKLQRELFQDPELAKNLLEQQNEEGGGFFSNMGMGEEEGEAEPAPDDDLEQKKGLLSAFPYFYEQEEAVHSLATLGELVEFEANQIIFEQDTIPDGLIFFPAPLTLTSTAGSSLDRDWAILGSLSILDDPRPCQTTAIAQMETTALLVPALKLIPLLHLNLSIRDVLLEEVLTEEEDELAQCLVSQGRCAEQLRLIRRMINNMGQAIFTIDPKGEVGEYSLLAAEYLHYDQLGGRPFADLILRQDEKSLKSYYRALSMLHSGNRLDPEVIISLLPNKVVLEGKTYRLLYQIVEDTEGYVISVVVRMEDITRELENKRLEEEAERIRQAERIIQERIRENIGSYLSLIDLINEQASKLAHFRADYLDDGVTPTKEDSADLMNGLHTTKGLCGQFELTELKEASHAMEDAVQDYLKDLPGAREEFMDHYKTFNQQADFAKTMLDSIGDTIIGVLQGINFTQEEYQEVLKEAESQQWHDLKFTLKQKTFNPAKDLVENWERDIQKLSSRLNKRIKFSLHADERLRLPKEICRTLNFEMRHLYRNCIDHGVEVPEERTQAGKAVVGKIVVTMGIHKKNLRLIIEDDGKGVNRAKVGQLARAKAQLDQTKVEELIAAGEEEKILFLPGFSSSENVTDISGRGVGMDAVEQALNKLNGTINIKSIEGKGTKFYIQVPLKETKSSPEAS